LVDLPNELIALISSYLEAKDAGRLSLTCKTLYAEIEFFVDKAKPSALLAIDTRVWDDGSYKVPMRLRAPFVGGLTKKIWNGIIFWKACEFGCMPLAIARRPPLGDERSLIEGMKLIEAKESNIPLYRWIVTNYNLPRSIAGITPLFYMGEGGYEWYTTHTETTFSALDEICVALRDGRLDIAKRIAEDTEFDPTLLANRPILLDAAIQTDNPTHYGNTTKWCGSMPRSEWDYIACIVMHDAITILRKVEDQMMIPHIHVDDYLGIPAIIKELAVEHCARHMVEFCLERTNDKRTMMVRLVGGQFEHNLYQRFAALFEKSRHKRKMIEFYKWFRQVCNRHGYPISQRVHDTFKDYIR
jgi:hypothetical protein